MISAKTLIDKYLDFCRSQKQLDKKTLKAYGIDLTQFYAYVKLQEPAEITFSCLEDYIAWLHAQFQPKTAKRKIAALKTFFRYLENQDIIEKNPFEKIQLHFREPVRLPKTIPLNQIEMLLSTLYKEYHSGKTDFQRKTALRNVSVVELLFATGIRISELCLLPAENVNLQYGIILIHGKGNKERWIHVGNQDVIDTLAIYKETFQKEILQNGNFFVNPNGTSLSDQAVRRMLKKYALPAGIHITPHMFRHTFATSLLEADVDIRYIQEMLGHSSIKITEIYTHVATSKQKAILTEKHPRKDFHL